MKLKSLLGFGLPMFLVALQIQATAQGAFPSKLPPRRFFRTPVTKAVASLPRPKSNIALRPMTSEDHGNVSVLHDDGTLIIPQNLFDLVNASLVFTPQGSGYTVQSVAPTWVDASNN